MTHIQHPIYTIPKQGDHMTQFFSALPWWLIVAGCVIGYGVGRVGLSAAWSDVKSVGHGLSLFYAGIRNSFSAQKSQAPAPAPTPAA